jgi:hypothetical protein
LSQVKKADSLPPAFAFDGYTKAASITNSTLKKLQPRKVFRDTSRGDTALGIQAMFAVTAARANSPLRFTLPYTGAGGKS